VCSCTTNQPTPRSKFHSSNNSSSYESKMPEMETSPSMSTSLLDPTSSRPENPGESVPLWTLKSAKQAVHNLAVTHTGGVYYPLTALLKRDAKDGLVGYINDNYGSIAIFAAVTRLPIRGQKNVSNYQYRWSRNQISMILKEVARVEGTEFLPTNCCLRDRGLGWLEQTISGKSKEFSQLTGLRRSTFRERAAQRDRSTYHKTWTLPAAIKATRSLAAKLQTRGFLPTIKQFRANKLNWLSCLISQKFGGIERFAQHCALKLRRMSRNRKLRKPRHMLRRVARSKKRLAEVSSHLGRQNLPVSFYLPERGSLALDVLGKRPRVSLVDPENCRKRFRTHSYHTKQESAEPQIKAEPRWQG